MAAAVAVAHPQGQPPDGAGKVLRLHGTEPRDDVVRAAQRGVDETLVAKAGDEHHAEPAVYGTGATGGRVPPPRGRVPLRYAEPS